HAQGLEGRGHGVGRVHAAARTRAGNGVAFDVLQFLVADLARGVLAHGLEHAHDVQVAAVQAAGLYGASVHIDAGHVGAQHAHHAAGHVLVAAAYDHAAVHPLALHAGLDTVGDDLAAYQAVL